MSKALKLDVKSPGAWNALMINFARLYKVQQRLDPLDRACRWWWKLGLPHASVSDDAWSKRKWASYTTETQYRESSQLVYGFFESSPLFSRIVGIGCRSLSVPIITARTKEAANESDILGWSPLHYAAMLREVGQ
jgi:hypothetical protein